MPRLCLGFDMEQFLNHCRMTKPPYECPHASCSRVYRSLAGIQNHMTAYDHENPPPNLGTPKNASGLDAEPLPIPMSTDLKMVEFELDGKIANLSVYDPIEVISKENFEASLPPIIDEPPTPVQPKTPSAKPHTKHLNPKTPKNRTKDKDRGVDVQRYTIEEKKSQKLPEAAFKIIPDYYKNLPDAPKRTEAYYKFVEKSVEELDEEVEYDMDEEDRAWLSIINQQREEENLDLISMENFELLMDRLEKESFFQAQSTGRETGAPIDEDAVCCICMDGECQNSNVILFCDMCNLAVHQECYGVPYIPEGQWLCRRCLQSPSRAVDCALCPNKGGAFKQTDDGRWAHVVCAMWIPEVCFANTVFLEPIDSIGNIPPARWKLTCYICVQRGVGACIQCNKVNCYTAFHVTCAQQAGLHMKIDAVRETNAVGTSVTVRKAAYCDMHTPADSDAVEEMMDAAKKAAAKAASRQKMKKARKILAEKRSAAPVVSVPILPADSNPLIIPAYWGEVNSLPVPHWHKIQQLANLVNIEKRSLFIHRLLAFWTLKRQSRNGVPLLRRLTTSYSRRNNNNNINNSNIIKNIGGSPKMKQRSRKDVEEKLQKDKSPGSVKDEENKFREEIKYWQRLRQDLERARLLCELIRKREKTKRELVKARAEERFMQLAPFVHLLLQKIDLLQERDTQQIFAEPVDFEEVPDYLDVVKHPMDLSTMRQKAQAHQYQNVDQFNADFELMIDNCLTYNSKDTVFYRAAVKLNDAGGAIIRQLLRDVEHIGFDPETGLLLPQRPKPLPEMSEDTIAREVDDFLNDDPRRGETYEERKEKLLNLLDKANLLKHPVARIKRVKLIRRELGIVRRKLATNANMRNNSSGDSEDNSERDETDMDDSSVIDDEAEPGCPSRPTSPASTNANTPLAPQTPITNNINNKLNVTPSISSPSQRSMHPTKQQNGQIGTPASSVKSVKKKPRKNDLKPDVKQKRIDSFFSKSENGLTPSKNDSVKQPIKETKTHEEKDTPKTKPVESKNPSTCPRKRGRPPRSNNHSRSLSAIGISGGNEEKKKELPKVNNSNKSTNSKPEIQKRKSIDESTEDQPINDHPQDQEEEDPVEEEPLEDSLTSVPSSPSGVNRRTSVLFTKKADALFRKAEDPISSKPGDTCEAMALLDLDRDDHLTKESFKIYRQEISQESDEETQSESNSSVTDSEEDSCSESGTDDGASDSDSSGGLDHGSSSGQAQASDQIPLEPLDLVWAKCRGYPWYPALIINPKMPRTGYFHNRVPIPVPPDEVLAHATNYHTPMYLVLFFDQKRTWQWLPRNKLEPLGENSALDKAKLVESRKPADRKAVKKAYEKAILHRCRVTGDNTGLSGESDVETNPP